MIISKTGIQHKITPARIGRALWSLVRGVIIIGICFTILQPLFVKLSVSFMSEQDLLDSAVKYIPKHFTLGNYKLALKGMDYWNSLSRTFLLSAGVALLQLCSCMLTAYGFARFRFPFKKLLFGCVILMLIVPPQIIMLPLYMHFRFFDVFGLIKAFNHGNPISLLKTYWPFVIQAATCTGFKNGLFIYMLRQFFKGMPRELEEAAFMDGCNKFRTFIRIILPSSVPMMVTIFLFGFVWQWLDSFYTSMYLAQMQSKVIPVALDSLAASVYKEYNNFGGSMNFVSPGFVSMMNNTGTILAIVPLIILYIICQRYFVEGIERSGIVG
ncbi:MAG: carbohydrate ABC transporter permease [Lachnospiraceae bacterium]|nr:carbohydrate ABC transporter permease [Lachnospiraceae bacterium]